jgi:short-subunit dehydrogenase
MSCYSATKWATEALAKTLALELQKEKVVVVSLDPGVVNTQMLQQSCGPQELEWCHKQRGPEDFAADAGPFLLSLSMADTGRNLTVPGCPPSSFQTAVAYKDRPAWANGFSSFHTEPKSKNRAQQQKALGRMEGVALAGNTSSQE